MVLLVRALADSEFGSDWKLMVRACGGIEGNQIGQDATLCMGGKARRKCGGSFESVSSPGDTEEAASHDPSPRRSFVASETHSDSFLKVPRFPGYGLASVYLEYFRNWLLCVARTFSYFLVRCLVLFVEFEW